MGPGLLALEVVLDPVTGDGLGPLQRKSQGSVPEQLREGPHGAGHPEKHRVIVELLEPIVPEQDTTGEDRN